MKANGFFQELDNNYFVGGKLYNFKKVDREIDQKLPCLMFFLLKISVCRGFIVRYDISVLLKLSKRIEFNS